jgi:hypothetical protein
MLTTLARRGGGGGPVRALSRDEATTLGHTNGLANG